MYFRTLKRVLGDASKSHWNTQACLTLWLPHIYICRCGWLYVYAAKTNGILIGKTHRSTINPCSLYCHLCWQVVNCSVCGVDVITSMLISFLVCWQAVSCSVCGVDVITSMLISFLVCWQDVSCSISVVFIALDQGSSLLIFYVLTVGKLI